MEKTTGVFQKGMIPWNKGVKTGIIPKSAFKKGNHGYWAGKKRPAMTGINHFAWRGDEAGYMAIHDWIKYHYGKADKCEQCRRQGVSKRFEWANVSGEYKKDINDWIKLCSKCHHQVDDIVNRGWKTKKGEAIICA